MAIETKHQWLGKLASHSPSVANLCLAKIIPDGKFVVCKGKTKQFYNPDAYSLANCDVHTKFIAETFDMLARKGIGQDKLIALVKGLIQGEAYGTFCEIAAYAWLDIHATVFDIQVPMTASEVICENGSIIDGRVKLLAQDAYFDVKAFGFHAHKITRLKDRLKEKIPDREVLIDGSWDVSVNYLESLLSNPGFGQLQQELLEKTFVKRRGLELRLQEKKAVTVSHHTVEPYRLARENADYPFRFAKQFSRHAPFLLFFVIPPWFSQGDLDQDFAGTVSTFTRALARRAFMQYADDPRSLFNTTFSEASRLLSGIVFINAWIARDRPLESSSAWIYLNPRAAHKLTRWNFALILNANPHRILLDDFSDDDY